MHGFLMGLPIEHLQEFTAYERLPVQMLKTIIEGHPLYNWPTYAKAFGYVSISKIISLESVSKYITKYISKDLLKTKIDLNNHLYYASQGLKRAELLYIGRLTQDLDEDFSNDYVKIKTVRSLEDALQYFTDKE